MLLSITTTCRPATDLGFLLVKHLPRVRPGPRLLPRGRRAPLHGVLAPRHRPDRAGSWSPAGRGPRPGDAGALCQRSALRGLVAAFRVPRAGLWQRLARRLQGSAKARQLLRDQYAAVGAAATSALADVSSALARASTRNGSTAELLSTFQSRADSASRFVTAYRHYCWPVDSLDDLELAPFHLLATEGAVHTPRDPRWHLDQLAALCARDPGLLLATAYKLVDVTDPESVADGVAWWTELTDAGGEGMVIKPLDWIVRGKRGLVQPAVKCRGREYLRVIYGPTYTEPDNLARLRRRGLGTKRSLALREFALGLEALHRFVDREPLYRVHECTFGVLALESEPVDPRL